jgi:hypothetical protein
LKKVSVCKALRWFVSNRRKPAEPTPKRQAAGSNPVRGAKTPDIAKYPAFYNFFRVILPTNSVLFLFIRSEYFAYKFSAFLG